MQQNCRGAAHMQRVVAGVGNNWYWLAGTLRAGLSFEHGVLRLGRVARGAPNKSPVVVTVKPAIKAGNEIRTRDIHVGNVMIDHT